MAQLIVPRAWRSQPFVPARLRPAYRDAFAYCQSAGGAVNGDFGFVQQNTATVDRYEPEGVGIYADHGGSVDDRFALLTEIDTAKSAPLTTIVVMTMRDSGHDQAAVIRSGHGHMITFESNELRIGYQGENGYQYLFKSSDGITYSRAYYVGRTFTFVVSTDPVNKIISVSVLDEGRSVPLVDGYGLTSYIGQGKLPDRLSGGYLGETGYTNYYHARGLLRVWAVIPQYYGKDEVEALADEPWQIFDRAPLLIPIGAGGGSTHDLAASGSAAAAGSATPSADYALAAVGVVVASGTAQTRAEVSVAAVGYALTGGAAALDGSTNSDLSASGAAQSGGSADLVASVTIGSADLATAAGTAGLSADVLLAGAGAAQAAGNAALAAQLNALAAGAAQAGGSATLSGGAAGELDASGSATSGGTAALSIVAELVATGTAQSGGSATAVSGSTGVLSAAGGASADAAATLRAQVAITASGFAQAMGAGYLVIQVPLSAAGAGQAGGTASALVVQADVLIPSRRFSVHAPGRVFAVCAPGRSFKV